MFKIFKRSSIFIILCFVLFLCLSVDASSAYFVWEKTVINVPLNASLDKYIEDYEVSFYVDGRKSNDFVVYKEVDTSTFSTVLTHRIGRYTVYYKAVSNNHNISSTQGIVFNVIDVMPPNVVLSTKTIRLEYGEELDIKRYVTVTDDSCSVSELIYTLNDQYVLYNIIGQYEANLVVSDKYNNSSKVNFTIEIVDNIKPEIFVLKPLILNYGEEFEVSEYILAMDNYNGDVTKYIEIEGLNVNLLGKQNVVINAKDYSNNQNSIMVEATVVDEEKPNIILKSDELILDIVNFNDYDVEFFYNQIIEISDNYSTNDELEINIDYSKLKEKVLDYEVFYHITDENNNTRTKILNVKLREMVGPVLKGESIVYLNLGEEVDLLSLIEATDPYDNEVNNRIKVLETNLNILEEGKYFVKFICYNSSGLYTEKLIEIVVGDDFLGEESPNSNFDFDKFIIIILSLSVVVLFVVLFIKKKHKK